PELPHQTGGEEQAANADQQQEGEHEAVLQRAHLRLSVGHHGDTTSKAWKTNAPPSTRKVLMCRSSRSCTQTGCPVPRTTTLRCSVGCSGSTRAHSIILFACTSTCSSCAPAGRSS